MKEVDGEPELDRVPSMSAYDGWGRVGGGTADAENILKPALSRGEIQASAETGLLRTYRKSIEKERSLERRFKAVKVPPPSEDDAIKIIKGIQGEVREVSDVP